ncbi:hypothetical protein, partial [Halopseudomonas sp.]|uniref:hypothetical protein n=1 Tax=Halopseudomonas sp. TaxID=2901191 RepID=UPI00311F67D3
CSCVNSITVLHSAPATALPLRGDMSALLRHVSTEAHQSARAYPTKRMIGRLQFCHPRIDAVSSIISEQRRLTFERDRPVIGKFQTIMHELA